jgi:hypothetical protein
VAQQENQPVNTTQCAFKVDNDRPVVVRDVRSPDVWTIWFLSPNLTTREGDIRRKRVNRKACDILERNQDFFEEVSESLYGDLALIATKDGAFGALYAIEYLTHESYPRASRDEMPPGWIGGDLEDPITNEQMAQRMLQNARQLAEQYPTIAFAVPHETEFFDNRVLFWAFVPHGVLGDALEVERFALTIQCIGDDSVPPL